MIERDRTFAEFGNWEEFLTRWDAIDMVDEATGLLYAGTKVPPFHIEDGCRHKEKEAAVKTRVDFYLNVAEYKNPVLASTAQRLIVKAWLKRMSLWTVDSPGYKEAHFSVLNFLQTPRESILAPPHPRFVSAYLLPICEEWDTGTHPDYSKGAIHRLLQKHGSLIVRAMCAWGLAYQLAHRATHAEEKLPILKEFLDKQKFNPGEIIENLSGHGEPQQDLSNGGRIEVVAKAYLNLLYDIKGEVHLNRGG
jgi:hypothetical protein